MYFTHRVNELLWNCSHWILQNTFNDRSTLLQVMAWCHQATNHLSQCHLWQIYVAVWGGGNTIDCSNYQPNWRWGALGEISGHPVLKWATVTCVKWQITSQVTPVSPGITIHTLTHWGRDKMAVIYQTAFSNAFSWMKIIKFWVRFHWSLSLRV